MKKKKLKLFIWLIIVIVFIILGLVLKYYITRLTPEDFVSSDFILIIKSDNIVETFKKVEKAQLLYTILKDKKLKKYYTLYVNLKTTLFVKEKSFVKLINSPVNVVIYEKLPPVFLFDEGIKSLLFKAGLFAIQNLYSYSDIFKINSIKYESEKIYELTIIEKRSKLYFSQIRNIVLLSIDKKSLMKSIDNLKNQNNLKENEFYLQVKSKLRGSGDLKIFFNTKFYIRDLRKTQLKRFFHTSAILTIGGIKLLIERDKITGEIFHGVDILDEKARNLFRTAQLNFSAPEILPVNTANYISINFENFKDVWYQINKLISGDRAIQKKLLESKKNIESLIGMPVEEGILSWLGNEIIICHIKNSKEPLIILKSKDISRSRDIFKILTDKVFLTESKVYYKNYIIKKIKFPFYFKIIINLFTSGIELPYYLFYKNKILLSNSLENIKNFIDANEREKLLIYDEKLKHLLSATEREGNIYYYWNLRYRSSFFIKKGIISRIYRFYKRGGINLKLVDDGIEGNFILYEPSLKKAKILNNWPIKINAKIENPPIISPVDLQDLSKMIIQDIRGKIFIYDFFAQPYKAWPVKVNRFFSSPPFVIKKDNKFLIGALTIDGFIYLWNNEGFVIDNYPLKIDTETREFFLKDINDDNTPEIIYVDNEYLYAINLKAKPLEGFPVDISDFPLLFIEIKDLIPDSGKEIFLLDENGNVKIINNKGKEVKTFSLIHFYEIKENNSFNIFNVNKDLIAGITENNKVYIWDFNGIMPVSYPYKIEGRITSSPIFMDVNDDNINELLFFTQNKSVYIINPLKGEIYKKGLEFTPLFNGEIKPFDINNDDLMEIIISGADKKIHFINTDFEELFTITGTCFSEPIDIDRNGHYEILTATKNGVVFLYEIQ